MDFKKESKKYEEVATRTLQNIIQINSVYDEQTITKEHPYGAGVANAFDFMKKLALKDGFNVDMCDGHCIEISTGKDGKTIGIFAHLDVVPISGEWTYPAFGGEIHNEKIYGRGTSDDKGPAIAAYYALKLLKDNNLVKGYKVKLVLGGDEERGSSCLKYYFNVLKKPQPEFGFTPDGDFPLIYGEKGICDYKLTGELNLDPVIEIDAGVAPNAVIDTATVTLKKADELLKYLKNHPEYKYNLLKEENGLSTIKFIGKSAHGSVPEKGINAGMNLLIALSEVYKNKDLIKFVNQYKDVNGRGVGECYQTKYLGITTYNLGILKYKNGVFTATINFRYPEGVNTKELFARLQKGTTLKLIAGEDERVLYFDPEKTEFIKVLADVYVRETGDTTNKPLTIGGGTYAKECTNVVAFGSHFPNKEDNIHSPDEKIDIEDFYGSIPLYADAILSLGKIK